MTENNSHVLNNVLSATFKQISNELNDIPALSVYVY